MLKSVFIPNKSNSFAWFNLVFIIVLILTGEVSASTVLFGYFLETIIIGAFNIFKMYACRHQPDDKSVWFYIPFFIVHYGGFIAVQSIFLFAIFSVSDSSFFKEPFHLIDNYQTIFQLEGMPLMLLVLAFGQLVKYYFDFLQPQKFKQFKVSEIMFKPYLRIVVQQFVVILGGFFIAFSQASIITAIILVLVRFLVDFCLVSIKSDSRFLDYLVDKMYDDDGKLTKDEFRKQLLLFSE